MCEGNLNTQKKIYMSNIFLAICNTPGLCTDHVYLTRAYTLASKSVCLFSYHT